MNKLKLIFFRMSQEAPLVKELSNYYKNKENYEVEFISNDREANKFLSTSGSGIFLFEVKSKLDLQNSVSVLKSQRKLIKSGYVKPACILHVKNKKVEKILSKYGCVDLLDDDIKAKTFSFKIDFWSRGLTTLLKKQEKELELKSAGANRGSGKKDEKKEDFVLVEPLNLQSDIWLFKTKSDYKKILRRWLLRALGPSPHVGTWMELEPQPGDRLPTWKYVVKNDQGQYIMEDGAWFFSGSKPEFDWKINRWNFSSDAPHLYFYAADGQVFSRFKFENGSVKITENSTYALVKEEIILESCDSRFNIEGDEAQADAASNIDGEGETDELGGKLEGKNSGEESLGGHLSGKTNAKTSEEELKEAKRSRSDFNEDNDLDGHYGGKAGTDELDRGPFGGKLKGQEQAPEKESKRSEFKEDSIDGHYGGTSSTDELDRGPLAGKLKGQEQTPEKESKRSEFKDESIDGHYGGKSSTDELDRGPLGGKRTDELDRGPLGGKLKEQEQSSEKEPKRSEFEEEAIDGHYGGKSSTDELDRSPLGGKLKPNTSSKEKDARKSEFKEDDQGGHYGGEAGTDKLDRGPLGGKLKPTAQSAGKDPRRSEFEEGDQGGHYGGEAGTDKLDRGPLGGKLKPTNSEQEKDSRKSKFEEDDLGGHLGGEAGTDAIDRSPLGGKLKPASKVDKENRKSAFEEDDLGGHLGGDSRIDEIARDPLSAKAKDPNQEQLPHGDLDELDSEDSITREGLNPIDQDRLPDAVQLQEVPKVDLSNTADLDNLSNPEQVNPLNKVQVDTINELERDKVEKPPAEQLKQAMQNDSELAKQVEEELGRSELKAIDKDGNVIPLSKLALMSTEELSRAGIEVLDPDGKSIPVEKVTAKIIDELSRVGISALEKEEAEKKSSEQSIIGAPAKGQLKGGIEEDKNTGKQHINHKQSLEAKSGRELWDDQAQDEDGTLDNPFGTKNDAFKTIGKSASPSESDDDNSSIESPFGSGGIRQIGNKADIKAAEMEEALGGGLSGDIIPFGGEDKEEALTVAGEEVGQEESFVIGDILNHDPGVNTESGDLKVVLKQQTKAGNDITFICNFEDFYEDELIVHAPKDSLPVGSEVKAKVTLAYSGKKIVVYAEGKIEEIEELTEKKEILVISISGLDNNLYNEFMALYQERQGSIEDFLQKAKGF